MILIASKRKTILFGLAVLAGLLTQSCAGAPASKGGEKGPFRIQSLSVNPERNGIEVILIGQGPIRYFAYPLKSPDRFIVDMAGITFGDMTRSIDLGGDILKRLVLIDGEAPDHIGRMELEYGTAGKAAVRTDGNTLIVRVARPAPTVRPVPPATEVSKISVEAGSDGVQVVVTGNGGMAPEAFRFKEKYLVVDIPGVVNKGLPNTVSVNHPLVGKIRVGQHLNPTKVRLVLHLTGSVDYEVKTGSTDLHLTLRPGK